MKNDFRRLALAGVVLAAAQAAALGPHEILLLANKKSRDSVDVAQEYARLRGVPDSNLVLLSVPKEYWAAGIEIPREEFTRQIWEPASRAALERRVADHILAWVYSVDFPVRIAGEPGYSVQGLTFLRNTLPDLEKVRVPDDVTAKLQGQPAPLTVRVGFYVSPMYAGPDSPDGRAYFGQTLEMVRGWLRDEMPLPSMMLGYTGTNGNTRAEVLECLRRGVQSDGTQPTGTVFFLTGDDVRVRARYWQFPGAIQELADAGVGAMLTSSVPAGADGVLGVMAGTDSIDPGLVRGYRPGALAEHMTSHGANFDNPHQTKITAWIRAGATATAGTVSEPRALWTKFPNARLFVHYAGGCCALESFYQSIRSPLQTIVIGEPLAPVMAARAGE